MFKKITMFLPALVLATAAGLAQAGDEFADGFVAAQHADYAKAAAKWEPLAKLDHPSAQFLLGTLYHSGQGGRFDEKAAVALYHQAAEAGVYMAQEYLATAYREGWFGLKKDAKKAKYWERKLEAE